jgi:hypothetical protein
MLFVATTYVVKIGGAIGVRNAEHRLIYTLTLEHLIRHH